MFFFFRILTFLFSGSETVKKRSSLVCFPQMTTPKINAMVEFFLGEKVTIDEELTVPVVSRFTSISLRTPEPLPPHDT